VSAGFDDVGGFQGASSGAVAALASAAAGCGMVRNADHDLEPTDGPTDPSPGVINSRLADFFDRHLR
jgi:hypothetical protein